MSSVNASNVGGESSGGATGGSLAHLRFGGKAGAFPLWKMKVVAHMVAHAMYEVVEFPLATTDKEMRRLLSSRAGDALVVDEEEEEAKEEAARR